MDQFNPFTDLSPVDKDRAIEQLGGATENNLQQLQFRLRFTSEYTKQFLNVLRDKNKSFKKDLDRIKVLDERLKRQIPVIPGMPGIAGNIFGEEGFPPGPLKGFPGFPGGLPGRIPRRPRQPSPVPEEVPQEQTQKNNILETIRKLLQIGYTIDQIRRLLQGLLGGQPAMADEIDDAIAEELVRKQEEDRKKLLPLRKLPIRAPEPDLLTKEQFLLSLKGEDAKRKKADPAFLNQAYSELTKTFYESGGRSAQIRTPDGGVLQVRPVGNPALPGGVIPSFTYLSGREYVKRQQEQADAQNTANLLGNLGQLITGRPGVRQQPGVRPQTPTTPPGQPQFSRLPPRGTQRPTETIAGQRIKKRGETKLSRQQIEEYLRGQKYGPDKLTADDVQGAIDALSILGGPVSPPGTIANFMGLNSPSIRNQFLSYLLSVRKTKQGLPNYGFFEKILRQIGLIKGSTPPKQVDNDAFRFLMNYHIKFGISPRNLIKQMEMNQMIDPSTRNDPSTLNKMGEAIEKGRESEFFRDLKPFREQYDLNLQSLNIDTDVNTLIVIMKPRFVTA